MSAPKCEVCGRGPTTGHNLVRRNAMGVVGIWRCEWHRKGVEVPTDVEELCAVIDRFMSGKKKKELS